MKTTTQDLRLLICEDEYLLAIDMEQQFSALRADVVGIAGSLADLRRWISTAPFKPNAVIIDVRFADGMAYDAIAQLHDLGAAVVVCSGYAVSERPLALSQVPWFTKPVGAEDLSEALCAILDARSGVLSD